MKKKVIIAVDSTADIPQSVAERYGIKNIALYVNIGEKSYRDGTEITAGDIIKALQRENGPVPTTSSIPTQEYKMFFESLLEDAKKVVYIALGSKISSTYANAVAALKDIEENKVFVIDSGQLSSGISLLAVMAAKMAQNDYDAEEIVEKISALSANVQTSFVLNSLDALERGGRCSALTALGANLLGIKVCIAIKNGKLEVKKKYMGKIDHVYNKYIKDTLSEHEGQIERSLCFITNSCQNAECAESALESASEVFHFDEVILNQAGAIVTSHCGEGCLGIIFMTL